MADCDGHHKSVSLSQSLVRGTVGKRRDPGAFKSSDLHVWLRRYSWHRPDGSQNFRALARWRLLSEDNLFMFHT